MSSTGRQSIVDERALGVTSIFSKIGGHAVLDHDADSDEETLVALGYKQEFKRYLPYFIRLADRSGCEIPF
jgi:hypothetical protein